LTPPSIAQEEKRRLILSAAVRVFASKGYHASRVDDIAAEAGVAHGLLYHYFASKEELLETIFRETWAELLGAIRAVEESGEPVPEQLRRVAAILLRSWRRDPNLVRVLVREIARSPHLQRQVHEIEQAFAAIERIVEHGQADGSFRADLEPRLARFLFYGAVEEILTGWVLEQLDDSDEAVEQAERAVAEVFCAGFGAERAQAPV